MLKALCTIYRHVDGKAVVVKPGEEFEADAKETGELLKLKAVAPLPQAEEAEEAPKPAKKAPAKKAPAKKAAPAKETETEGDDDLLGGDE